MTETRIFCDAPGCKAEIPASRTVVSIASGTGKKAADLLRARRRRALSPGRRARLVEAGSATRLEARRTG